MGEAACLFWPDVLWNFVLDFEDGSGWAFGGCLLTGKRRLPSGWCLRVARLWQER